MSSNITINNNSGSTSTPSVRKAWRAGLRRKQHVFTFVEFKGLVASGAIVIADWNRPEVTSRPGSAGGLLASLRDGRSVGMFLGYRHGGGESYYPTPENPLYVSDGGHRMRWMKEIFAGTASADGDTYATLDEVSRGKIDAREMTFDTSYHVEGESMEDKAMLVEHAKEEYRLVNSTTAPLSNGEVLRANTDATLVKLVEDLEQAFSLRDKAKEGARDKDLEVSYGMIVGLATGPEHMTKKREDVLDLNLTPEQVQKVSKGITYIKQVEDKVFQHYAGNQNALSILKVRKPDLQHDGPWIARLSECNTDAEYAEVVEKAVKAYIKMLSTARIIHEPAELHDIAIPEGASAVVRKAMKADAKKMKDEHKKLKEDYKKQLAENLKTTQVLWRSYMARVGDPGAGNKARFYNKKRFDHGWSQFKTIATE
jgi:hypothetical protein